MAEERLTGPIDGLVSFMPAFLQASTGLGAPRGAAGGAFEPNLEARIAAIFALRHLAQQYPAALPLVVDVLCAYVRLNSGWVDAAAPSRRAEDIPADVQLAVESIGHRCDVKEPLPCRIDLTRTDLRGVRLWGADLRGAVLARALLGLADLGEVDFEGAVLLGSNLDGSILVKANFSKADLWCAKLVRSNLIMASFRGASLANADLRDSILKGADFSDAHIQQTKLSGAHMAVLQLAPEQLAEVLVESEPAGEKPRRTGRARKSTVRQRRPLRARQ